MTDKQSIVDLLRKLITEIESGEVYETKIQVENHSRPAYDALLMGMVGYESTGVRTLTLTATYGPKVTP